MSKIAFLAVEEVVNIDQRRVGEIVSELGQSAANTLLSAALEQLASSLRDTQRASALNDLGQVVGHADRLSRLAWQVGLVSLAGVAVDVGQCAERRDGAGLSATLARLERIATRSLTEIWDQLDP